MYVSKVEMNELQIQLNKQLCGVEDYIQKCIKVFEQTITTH